MLPFSYQVKRINIGGVISVLVVNRVSDSGLGFAISATGWQDFRDLAVPSMQQPQAALVYLGRTMLELLMFFAACHLVKNW
jgi:hypothetical protein